MYRYLTWINLKCILPHKWVLIMTSCNFTKVNWNRQLSRCYETRFSASQLLPASQFSLDYQIRKLWTVYYTFILTFSVTYRVTYCLPIAYLLSTIILFTCCLPTVYLLPTIILYYHLLSTYCHRDVVRFNVGICWLYEVEFVMMRDISW